MPGPARVRRGKELFPEHNAEYYNLNTRKKAEGNQQERDSLLPERQTVEGHTGSDYGNRYQDMLNCMERVNTLLHQNLAGDEDGFEDQISDVYDELEALENASRRYLSNHRLALTQKARRRKRLARRLKRQAAAQRELVMNKVALADLNAYGGRMTLGEALLEEKSGFSLSMHLNIRDEDWAENLEDFPMVSLPQVTDRVMHQAADEENPLLKGDEDKGYGSLVGAARGKMLPMPDLKSKLGDTPGSELLMSGTDYFFKRNVGSIANLFEEAGFRKDITYEEAAAILRENNDPTTTPENPDRRKSNIVRIKSILYDPAMAWLPEGMREELHRGMRSMAGDRDGDLKLDNTLFPLNAFYRFFLGSQEDDHPLSKYGKNRKISWKYEQGRDKELTPTMPVEYQEKSPRTLSFLDRGIADESLNSAKKDVAVSIVDQLLGLNLVPHTVLAKDAHGRVGRLMERFKGKEFSNFLNEGLAKNPAQLFEKLNDGYLFRRIAEMSLLDLLCRQGDRHAANFTMYENDKGRMDLQAFDNDASFGSEGNRYGGMVSKGLTQYIPKEAAEKILALNMEDLRDELDGLLTENELDAMEERLEEMQKELTLARERGEFISNSEFDALKWKDIEKIYLESRTTAFITDAQIATLELSQMYPNLSNAEIKELPEYDKLTKALWKKNSNFILENNRLVSGPTEFSYEQYLEKLEEEGLEPIVPIKERQELEREKRQQNFNLDELLAELEPIAPGNKDDKGPEPIAPGKEKQQPNLDALLEPIAPIQEEEQEFDLDELLAGLGVKSALEKKPEEDEEDWDEYSM